MKGQQPETQQAVFIDAISGQHVSSDPQSLLKQRQLTFSKDYGWQYDVWIQDPGKYALSGANSRYSVHEHLNHSCPQARLPV